MKAVLVTDFGGPENLKYMDVEVPKVTPAQVLIKVEYTSVNFADIKSRYGKKGNKKVPFIPGLDAAGVIVEIGSEVTNLKVGQRVIAFPANGSYAEYVVADKLLTFPIPDNIEFGKAAASPVVSFLSYKLLADVARIVPGETVLIHSAAGGVGTTAIQMAKLLGAGMVIGTVGNESKIPVAIEAGADEVICYETNDFAQQVNDLTSGRGVNIILDSISGKVTENSLKCLDYYGRLVHFGNSSGETGTIKTTDVHSSCRSLLGFSFGTTRKMRPELLKSTAEQVINFLSKGQLQINIGGEYSLEDAADAHALIESRQSTGKIILKVTI